MVIARHYYISLEHKRTLTWMTTTYPISKNNREEEMADDRSPISATGTSRRLKVKYKKIQIKDLEFDEGDNVS